MSGDTARIHIDGASRGNPGPAAYAFSIVTADGTLLEDADRLPNTTNNVAEYTALVRALEKAQALGLKNLHILSDSELLVKQMNGDYRVKSDDLRSLYEAATALRREFATVTITHVRREQNQRADELCNLVLDGKWIREPAAEPIRLPQVARSLFADALAEPAPALDLARRACAAILEAAAKHWFARQEPPLSPDTVLDQLWEALRTHNALAEPKPTKRKRRPTSNEPTSP